MSENKCFQTPLQNNIPLLCIVDVSESSRYQNQQQFLNNKSRESFQSESQSHGFDSNNSDKCFSLKYQNSVKDYEDSDSKTDIVEEDTLDTRNSLNSLMIKSFTTNSQQVDNLNTKLEYISIDLAQSQEKSINYGDEELSNQINLPDVKSQKNETDSLKSSLIKRVTFSDFLNESKLSNNQNTDKKQQFIFQSSKGQIVKSDSKDQLSQEKIKIATKSILKRSQTDEQNTGKKYQIQTILPIQNQQLEQKKFQDEPQKNKFWMDYCCIRNDDFVQSLIKDKINQSIQNEQCFFSEQVIKISKTGEQKKRIILITDEFFYVLQDLYIYKHIKKFEISEINQIIISSTQNNVCSFIVRNSFKLSIQTKHFYELIKFIQTIFKQVLKSYIPIIKEYSQIIKHSMKESFFQNTKIKMEQFLNSQRREFDVQIQQIMNNTLKDQTQIEGFIYFFSSYICVKGLKSQDLNRLTQIELIHTDQQKKNFIFQSQKNSEILYSINLKNEEDLLIFINQINKLSKNRLPKIV